MTPLDLRIMYKSETGFAPTNGRGHHKVWEFYDNETEFFCNYKGDLTSEYAEWLESLDHGEKWKRNRYQQETGHYPVYYNYDRTVEYLDNYKQWLEEEQCYRNTILEENNIPIIWA